MAENILICIVIVYSVKILELTGLKYFQKLRYKSKIIMGGLCKVMPVCIRSFLKKVLKIKNVCVILIILYVFNTLFKVKECERVSTSKLLDS